MATNPIEYMRIWREAHREKTREYGREWYKNHPRWKRGYSQEWCKNHSEDIRNKRLQKLYGMSQNDYNTMLYEQEDRCAICGISIEDLCGNLIIDHDHITGKVRGLLCTSCNLGLGWFKDDIVRLEKAKSYLVLTGQEDA